MALRKLDEPSIDAADPWRNDDLQRKPAGETLARLVQGSGGSPVLSLKGSWGSGKSVFLKRVAAQLELKGVPVCLLDAWRSEYLKDPGLALAGSAPTSWRPGI
jgi:predicted AAA+ superfamily ATPase